MRHPTLAIVLVAAAHGLSAPRPRATRRAEAHRLAAVASSTAGGGGGPLRAAGRFAEKQFFVVGMGAAVAAAAAAPAVGVAAEPYVGKYAVGLVFLLSGLGLRVEELRAAALDLRLNAATQATNLLFVPAVAAPAVAAARRWSAVDGRLLDGLLATACLPTTVNMCVALTQSAGGNVAAALANAVLGNCLGVVATPALLYAVLRARVPLPPAGAVVGKLATKCLLPVLVGQVLRRSSRVAAFQQKRKRSLTRASELALLAIVWCAFAGAFATGFGVGGRDLALLGLGLPLAHGALLAACLAAFGRAFPRRDAVAAAYCASHKTLAFGLPLIRTIFAGSPDLAYYCAPIMILHPLQLLVGSLAVPRLRAYLREDA